jgi:hypothetical protein
MVRDSVASNNATTGFSAVSAANSGNAQIMIDSSNSSLNAVGLNAAGAAHSAILIGSSTLWNNSTGLSMSGGGQIFSFGNNQVQDLAGDIPFTPPNSPLK